MVVFEDGLPRKSEYRRFVIRGYAGRGDTASIQEVIGRRFRRYLEERSATGEVGLDDGGTDDGGTDDDGTDDGGRVPAGIDPDTGRPRRFAYPPNLVVVDGGAPQVAAARQALDALGVDDVALVGLAKRLEEVWLPGEPYPLVLPRASEGLYLLQRARDEAHRFAVALHRSRRSKSMTASALDGIPGLGETRRKALLRHFGSLKRLAAASPAEITAVAGIGPRTAEAVVAALAVRGPATPAVNMTTGEILDDDPSAEAPASAGSGGSEGPA
jgi:excinuclease ABC subunit C